VCVYMRELGEIQGGGGDMWGGILKRLGFLFEEQEET
jgi:hypothetical protein